MRPSIYFTLIFLFSGAAFSQTPKVSNGTIEHHQNFPSKFVPARSVDIWLPDGYDQNKKYPVLYMHDGMALFDSTIMWNKQSWHVDQVLTKLAAEKKIRECIVVGIWNGDARRHAEYFPQKPFESLPANQQDSLYKLADHKLLVEKIQSDNYLKFLVYELKPYVDTHFSTLTNRQNTFIAGSSMGGLISLYAICEYPKVFGGAACMSTHWVGTFSTENNPIPAAFMAYLKNNIPSSKTHKIYFDYGSKTLDSLYQPYQQQVDTIMKAKGYSAKNWMTRQFIGADHSEKSWNKRLDIPIVFLLGKKD